MCDSTFDADMEGVTTDIANARAVLISAVQRLADTDLDRARRSGWPIRRVLEHVIQSEWIYATLAAHLQRKPVPERQNASCEGQPVDEVLCMLDAGRTALLQALDGVDEDSFYEVQRVGRDEYSVLSVLENVAHHDLEHAGQISAIMANS